MALFFCNWGQTIRRVVQSAVVVVVRGEAVEVAVESCWRICVRCDCIVYDVNGTLCFLQLGPNDPTCCAECGCSGCSWKLLWTVVGESVSGVTAWCADRETRFWAREEADMCSPLSHGV